MGYFPFFIELKGKKGLIIGGGKIAEHKVEKLLPFGASLTVVAPVIAPKLKENPAVKCIEREFAEDDLEGVLFAVAASDDEKLNGYISRICQEKGILVNVVDDKEKCGFLFPALVKEGALTAGISTEGASPQVAALLRSEVASVLPEKTAEILDYLSDLRDIAKERISDKQKRAKFLKETALLCMEKNRALTGEETEQRIQQYEGEISGNRKKTGNVVFVDAGCGAYDLLTVRGLNAVRKAEVLIYDDEIDMRLLDHASESCEKIFAGKRTGMHRMQQEQLNALLLEKAKQGKTVVCLESVEPSVFGSDREGIPALGKAGIFVAEIPGIRKTGETL